MFLNLKGSRRVGLVAALLLTSLVPATAQTAPVPDIMAAAEQSVLAAGDAPKGGNKSVANGVRTNPAANAPSSAEELAAAAERGRSEPKNLPQDPEALAAAKSAVNAGKAGSVPQRANAPAHASATEGSLAAVAADRDNDYDSAAADDSSSSNAPANSGKAWTGISDTGWIPPDTEISVGTKHVIEVVNSSIRGFTKSGTTVLPQQTLAAFFGRPAGSFIFDPVTEYRGGRHYVVALFRDTAAQTSQILLARSNSVDVTAGWCHYALNSDLSDYIGGTQNWADFPGMGVTSSKVLIATNQYTFSGNSFLTNFLLELPKAQIDACQGFGYNFWHGFGHSGGGLAFAQKPATDYDADGANTFWLVNHRSGAGNNLNIWRRTISTNTWTNFSVTTASYTVPPDAVQPGTTTRIATNDARTLQGAVKWYGRLVVAHNTGLGCGTDPTTSNAHITAINAPAGGTPTSLFDFIYDQGCGIWDYFPAPAWDGNGNMLFGFNRSNSATYPQARFAGWHNLQGVPASVLMATGSNSINTTGRWGDYSGASVDPSNPDLVWFGLEVMQATNSWTTKIGKGMWKPNPLKL